MLCDHCKKEEAIIHIQEVRPDGNKTVNLCAECAMKQFMKLQPGNAAIRNIFSDIMNLVEGKDAKVRLEDLLTARDRIDAQEDCRCKTCNQSLEHFLKSHKLGCPDCADAFAKQLKEHLERMFRVELGNVPEPQEKRCQSAANEMSEEVRLKQEEIERIKRDIQVAILNENYEKAAQLRDILEEYLPVENGNQE